MEMGRFPGRIWVVAHKPVAAGMGVMGIHRNVIHPRFGNFVLLGTVVVASAISEYVRPLDYSPCLECKLCVAACPVGAIKKDGDFDVMACSVHNYREFMVVLRPLQDKVETLYVLPGSDAEQRARTRYPHKPVTIVDSGLDLR